MLVEAGGLTVPLADPEALVVANAGSSASCACSTTTSSRSRLAGPARGLSPRERQRLLDDAWAAAVDGPRDGVVVPAGS